jgi:hypothetical protein
MPPVTMMGRQSSDPDNNARAKAIAVEEQRKRLKMGDEQTKVLKRRVDLKVLGVSQSQEMSESVEWTGGGQPHARCAGRSDNNNNNRSLECVGNCRTRQTKGGEGFEFDES